MDVCVPIACGLDLGERDGSAPETVVAAAVGAHLYVVENSGIKS